MKIDFEIETPHGKFADALYFEDGAVPDDATIEAMKQQRVDNWIAVVTAPPTEETEEIKAVQERFNAAIKAAEESSSVKGI